MVIIPTKGALIMVRLSCIMKSHHINTKMTSKALLVTPFIHVAFYD